jgi:hypothetical protein
VGDWDLNAGAALVVSLHAPSRATLSVCLARWMRLDERSRFGAFLVVDEPEFGRKRTLNGEAIQRLVTALMRSTPP